MLPAEGDERRSSRGGAMAFGVPLSVQVNGAGSVIIAQS
jgi:hypothetical protein